MQILLTYLDGTEVALDVEASDTIANVKAKVHEKEGIPPDEQYLFSDEQHGEELKSDHTLSDHNVTDGFSVYCHRGPRRFQIRVRTLTGKNFIIDVSERDTVYSVKTQIEKNVRVSPTNQRIKLGNIELANTRTLSDCGIQHDATLQLLVKMCSSSWRRSRMQIFVKTLRGEMITLDAYVPHDTIDNLKCEIEGKDGVPDLEELRIFFQGEELENSRSFSSYDIQTGSTLYLENCN
jgi:ubiquitin C